MRHGRPPGGLRSLKDARAALEAGPEWLTLAQAAEAIGVCEQSVYDRGVAGAVLRQRIATPRGYSRYYVYHRDGVWRMAIELHGAEADAFAFDASDDTRATVLRMLDAWQGCETAQQLHDAARVRPLPPIEDSRDRDRRRPAQHEVVTCARCGNEFERVVDDGAPYVRTCKRCRVAVGKHATRMVRAFVAWRAGE